MGLMDLISGGLGVKNRYQAQPANLQDPGALAGIAPAQQQTGNLLGSQQSLAELLAGRSGGQNINYAGASIDPNAGNVDFSRAAIDPNAAAVNLGAGRIRDVTGGYNPAGIDFSGANQVGGSLQDLIGQVRGVAAGTGPNPAQEQFRQNVGEAVRQQAGAVASVRGLNPALAARLASQGGASMLQGAAGQAATLQAQQQIASQGLAGGLLSGLQGQLAGQAQAQGQLGAQQQQFLAGLRQQTAGQQAGLTAGLEQTRAGLTSGLAGQQAGLYAGLAGQQAGLRAGLTAQQAQLATQQAQAQAGLQAQYAGLAGGLYGTAGGQSLQQQQILQAALANLNAQRVGMQSNINNVNAGVAGQNASTNAGLLGGLLQGGGAAASLVGLGALSDERVKADVVRHRDEVINGVPRATFRYKGDPTEMEGVIAQDVERTHPDLAGELADGTKVVHPALAPHPMADGGLLTGLPDLPFAPMQAPAPIFSGPPTPEELARSSDRAKQQKAPGPMSELAETLQRSAAEGEARLRQFSSAPAYAPGVIGPSSFAEGGEAGADADTENFVAPAAVAHQIAESLAETSPRAAAAVYADLLGVPTDYTPEELRDAFHHLAFRHAALLAQAAAGTIGTPQAPVPASPAQRSSNGPRLRELVNGRPDLPTGPTLRETLANGGRIFARDGHVPGRARVSRSLST